MTAIPLNSFGPESEGFSLAAVLRVVVSSYEPQFWDNILSGLSVCILRSLQGTPCGGHVRMETGASGGSRESMEVMVYQVYFGGECPRG